MTKKQTNDQIPAKSTIEKKYNKSELAAQLVDALTKLSKTPVEDAGSKPTNQKDMTFSSKLEQNLFENGVLVKIDFRCWWGKSTKMRDGEINASKKVVSGVKELIDPKIIAGLRSFKGKGDRVVKKYGFPFPGLRDTFYIPSTFVPTVEEKLTTIQDESYKERDKFISKYSTYKKQWKETSGKYYDEKLYPTKVEFQEKFRFDWIKLGIRIYSEHHAKSFIENSFKILIESLIGKFQKLKDRLETTDPVKPKSISSVKAFAKNFEGLDISNSMALRKIVSKFGTEIAGIQAKDLNADKKKRKKVLKLVMEVLSSVQKAGKKDKTIEEVVG